MDSFAIPRSLSIKGVEKAFGSFQVLRDFSIDLRPGETFSLLGPSGCGKTTALRIIAGLEQAEAGEISFNERVWLDTANQVSLPPQKRSIGMVFQNYAIWPHMTVLDHVMYPLRGMTKQERLERARSVIKLVGLEGRESAQAVKLSGGQQQRVAIARAISKAPDLLLFDEPFSNLDANLREQMRVEIAQLRRQLNITMLIVTHDQLDAFALADRIGVMSEGRLVQVADGRTIYEKPATHSVREFIGKSISLDGVLTKRLADICVVELPDGSQLQFALGSTESTPEIGGRVRVWMRPEDATVGRQPEKGIPMTSIPGFILQSVFLGDRYHCLVQLRFGQQIWAYLPRTFHPQKSQTVSLLIDTQNARIEAIAS